MTDAKLFARARKGNRQAADELVTRHYPLVLRVVGQRKFPRSPEVFQIGRLALWDAAQRYQADRGPWPNYAGRIIAQRIVKHLAGENRLVNKLCGLRFCGLTRKVLPPVREQFADRPVSETAPESALDQLSPLPRVVCRLLSQGIDPVERLGLYRGELDRIRRRAFEEVA